MAEISIIIPVYNVKDYIEKCLDSVRMQDFSDFECIIVDDGSFDGSENICDRYAEIDNRVKVIHKKNAGVSAARNTGLSAANGKYITFCDGDDYYTQGWLQTLYHGLVDVNADFATSGYLYVSELGETLMTFKRKIGIWQIKSEDDLNQYLFKNILYDGNGWEVWSCLFRRDIIAQNHISFNENCGNYAEDLGFVLAYALYAKRFTGLAGTGYCYVKRGNSMIDRSVNRIKLNSVNTVSEDFGIRYLKESADEKKSENIKVLHFLIMHLECKRLLNTEQYTKIKQLPKEYLKIENQIWNKRNTEGFSINSEAYLHIIGSGYNRLNIDAEYMVDLNPRRYFFQRWSMKWRHYLTKFG